MKILVFFEKNHVRCFNPDDSIAQHFTDVFAKVMEERLKAGWYEGNDEIIASEIIKSFESERHNFLYVGKGLQKKIVDFMERRRIEEYEDWDIVDTEN